MNFCIFLLNFFIYFKKFWNEVFAKQNFNYFNFNSNDCKAGICSLFQGSSVHNSRGMRRTRKMRRGPLRLFSELPYSLKYFLNQIGKFLRQIICSFRCALKKFFALQFIYYSIIIFINFLQNSAKFLIILCFSNLMLKFMLKWIKWKVGRGVRTINEYFSGIRLGGRSYFRELRYVRFGNSTCLPSVLKII